MPFMLSAACLPLVLLTQADGGPAGSEYMASSIVKGCPDECLSVLVDLSSNTTILGPASKIELLEDGEERQVRCHSCQPQRGRHSACGVVVHCWAECMCKHQAEQQLMRT
jgi:hypothetical protein